MYPGLNVAELVLQSDVSTTKLKVQLSSRSDLVKSVLPSVELRGKIGDMRKVELLVEPTLVSGEIVAMLSDVRREPDSPPFSLDRGMMSASNVAREAVQRTLSIIKRDIKAARIESSAELVCTEHSWFQFDLSLMDGQVEEIEYDRLPDWDIDFPQGTKIRNIATIPVRVRPRIQAEARTIEIRGVSSGSTCLVVLVPPEIRKMKINPRFVIGIDFGTSSTSIAYIDTGVQISDSPEMHFLGGSPRFPSCVHVGNSLNRSTWTYGQEAVESSDSMSGEFIAEFKKFLWQEDQVEVASSLSAEEIFQWYLEQLFLDQIRPRLEAILGTELDGTPYILRFSMPVLGDDEAERYQQRIKAACRDAGFKQMGEIEFYFEPDSAMKGVLDLEGKALRDLKTGDIVMVVDSGAGTTDVCVGSVEENDGRWYLAVSHFEAVTFPSLRERGLCVGNNFGGGDVTRLIGSDAIERWADLASAPGDEGKDKRYTDCISSLSKAVCKPPKKETFYWPSLDSDHFEPFSMSADRVKYWDAVTPRLFGLMENAKVRCFEDSQDNYEILKINGITGPSAILRMAQKSISSAVETLKMELEISLQSTLDKIAVRPKWLIYVGGNMNIPQFQWKEPKGHIRRVTISEDSLRLAVVKGLIANHGQTKKLRFDVRVVLRSERFTQILFELRAKRMSGSLSSVTPMDLPSESVWLIVEALTEDGWKRLSKRSIPQGLTNAEFKVVYSRGNIRVSMKVNTSATELISMELPSNG